MNSATEQFFFGDKPSFFKTHHEFFGEEPGSKEWYERDPKRIELLVASRYEVGPVDSRRAFEEYVGNSGAPNNDGIKRFAHTTFVVKIYTDTSSEDQAIRKFAPQLVDWMATNLMRAWPVGSPVIWRKRPVLEFDDKKRLLSLYLRLGSNVEISPDCCSVREGFYTPTLNTPYILRKRKPATKTSTRRKPK